MSGSARNSSLGQYGERLAAQRLVEGGMVVLDRNWRCDLGELDLVLREGEVLVVCEVKTRSTAAFGHPLEAVSPTKCARLRRLAARWVVEHGAHPPGIRLDLVGVLLSSRGAPSVVHVRGVG
jgi:putative endonuclease